MNQTEVGVYGLNISVQVLWRKDKLTTFFASGDNTPDPIGPVLAFENASHYLLVFYCVSTKISGRVFRVKE